MITRRQGLAGSLCLSIGLLQRYALADQVAEFVDDTLPPLPPELSTYGSEDDYFSTTLEYETLGTAEPTREEIATAQEIMAQAPYNTRPIEVAQYYRDIGLGVYGDEVRGYARGWPRKYNPIIVEMFNICDLNPLAPGGQGDATPWCAAFVNYCIARAMSPNGNIGERERKFGTRSASSGSFRCWPTRTSRTDSPKEGDIVCWALEGTVHECALGKGHVGFFVAHNNDTKRPYIVLGGNQSGDLLAGIEARNDGMIQKAFPEKFKTKQGLKERHSFRTSSFLR
jgi:CHAP domain